MTIAVLGFTGFVFLVAICVVVGKSMDKKDQDYGGSYFMGQDGFDSGNNTDGTNKRN
ncbi:hypothetical protein [Enterococcus gallinarum]|uniref:hypothetical protein n=1 Tax=Enterococcus gallinarum TaxID=1353 RepID=UPI0018CE2726|nr:hypothetical protein [Enterococcus gallinarum]